MSAVIKSGSYYYKINNGGGKKRISLDEYNKLKNKNQIVNYHQIKM